MRYLIACSPLVNAAMTNSTKKSQPCNKVTADGFSLPDDKTIIFQRNAERKLCWFCDGQCHSSCGGMRDVFMCVCELEWKREKGWEEWITVHRQKDHRGAEE